MPEDSSGGEKSEDPTPKKRQKAREEGQVAFSVEANTAVLLLIGFGLLVLMGPAAYDAMASMMQGAMRVQVLGEVEEARDVLGLFADYQGVFLLLAGFMGVLFLLAILISVAQVGLSFSLKPLQPKAQRISPLAGLKRLFGMRGLMRFLFSVIKLVLIVAVAVAVLTVAVPDIFYFSVDLGPRFHEAAWLLIILALILAGSLALVALFDFLYQRWQHHKDLMMTKQEVKEEFKQSDGDPLVKQKIRQIQRQMAQQRMMQEVPKADVVITNPTHVAVALRYDQDSMVAPVCVAKGYDLVAKRIKDIAADHGIVQVENVSLARALAKAVKVGKQIPVDFYQPVAEVLGQVYRLKKQVG